MSLKVLLNFKLNWVLLCASFWLFALPIQAKYVVAVVGKTKNDSFYQQAFKGCEQFAKQHLDFECIYDGPKPARLHTSRRDLIAPRLNKLQSAMINTP